MESPLKYHSGFGSTFQSEAVSGTLPKKQNSPQKHTHGLYAEQLNGSAFTVSRHDNLRSWLYRIQPSVIHCGDFSLIEQNHFLSAGYPHPPTPPTQLRWSAPSIPDQPTNFIQGITTISTNGHPAQKTGGAIHIYTANISMDNHYFYNADGELLILPQLGELLIKTEFGILEVAPGEITIIPRGVRFQVMLKGTQARGYIFENYGVPFQLPNRGPIGANGLAEERHFLYPKAAYEEREGDFTLIAKFQGALWQTPIKRSPLDVVAWHGTYAPYKYDLALFAPVWAVSIDHSDPSIFTVLTSPSAVPGVGSIDFAIFPERWMTPEHTFRPPYFHRNTMSEFMGLIHGKYDAKQNGAGGFEPGGYSIHNCMAGHGVDAATFKTSSTEDLKPCYYENTLAFMLESNLVWNTTEQALNSPLRQHNYLNCWSGLLPQFSK